MSRRAPPKPAAGIQLFPLLAVVICTMGALVLLLVGFARQGHAKAIAAAKAAEAPPVDDTDLREIELRSEQLKSAREQTEARLAQRRLELSHLEDHQRRLYQELDKLRTSVAELERVATKDDYAGRQTAAELEDQRAKIARLESDLAESRRKAQNKQPAYSVVPYQGPNETRRRPIYIECESDSIVLQPECIILLDADFEGTGPGNPLAAAVRAAREHIASHQTPGVKEEPYPLLLVRPSGIGAYYAARAALASWGTGFGYELVGEDWELKFPETDPEMKRSLQLAVAEARIRQRELMQAAPRHYAKGARPTFRAAPRGGFVEEPRVGSGGGRSRNPYAGIGGSGAGARSGSAFNRYPGSGRGSMSGRPTGGGTGDGNLGGGGDLAGDGDGSDGFGNSGAPGGSAYANLGAPGVGSGGTGATMARGGAGDSEFGGLGGNGASGSGVGSSGVGGSSASSGASKGNGAGKPGDTTRGSLAKGGGAENGFLRRGGGAGGEPVSSGSTTGEGNAASGDPASEFVSAQGGSQRSATSRGSTGQRGMPGQGGGGMSQGGGGGQAGGSSGDQAASSGDPNQAQAPSLSVGQKQPQDKRPDSMAKTRGHNWGLPEGAARQVPVTRPVRVVCEADRLTIVPEQGEIGQRQIPLAPRTEDSVDDLVAGVWQHMKGWGMAGKGLYWRPTLVMDVKPGGAARYAELQALLSDSGLEVRERQQPAANARTASPRQR